MSDGTSPPASGRGWWIWASLLLNALLIGLIIGGLLNARGGEQDPRGPVPAEAGVRFAAEPELVDGILSKLEGRERRLARRDMRRAWISTREGRSDYGEAARELRSLLDAEPFDADAVAVTLRKMREAELEVRLRLETQILSLLNRLNVEDRNELVERFTTGERRRGGRRGLPGSPERRPVPVPEE